MRHAAVWGIVLVFMVGASGCRNSVEIIAHRGASYLAPENTLASVKLGWQKDADVEVDVYLSKDNRIVVIHDSTTKRTSGGTDLKVSESDSQELRKLDVGSFKALSSRASRSRSWRRCWRRSRPGGSSTSRSSARRKSCLF